MATHLAYVAGELVNIGRSDPPREEQCCERCGSCCPAGTCRETYRPYERYEGHRGDEQ